MTDRGLFGHSVFARLVGVMVALAVAVLMLVAGFFWFMGGPPATELHGAMRSGHTAMLLALLILIVAVVVSAHAVLKRLLGPLRALSRGVERLGAGDLDVVLPDGPEAKADEFGYLTRAFNDMARRVRGMVASRDQLLMDVSHELRSPLARMKVALELVPTEQRPAGMAADIADMERMIGELLELERLRSGGNVPLARDDLVALVRDVATNFDRQPPGVRLEHSPVSIPVEINSEQIRRVLRNVLENAVKYSGPDSQPVSVSVAVEDGRAVVRVRDYGPGIPEPDRDRVFEPFFRVDRSRARETGGYGLGLSICKRVMLAHGGDVTVETPTGGGAAFVLTLPMA